MAGWPCSAVSAQAQVSPARDGPGTACSLCLCVCVCRLQRCVKEVGRMAERCSGRPGLEKAQLQQLDRSLGEMARLLAGQVGPVAPPDWGYGWM